MSCLSYGYAESLMGHDALDFGLRALAAARRLHCPVREAWAMNRIGVAYSSLDNARQACEILAQALTRARTMPAEQDLAFGCLNDLICF